MGEQKLKILHENCEAKMAEDRSLPYTAYLVEYEAEGKKRFDLAISSKMVEIFDYYYDKYGKVLNMTQSNGRVNPKLWGNSEKKSKKK